MYDAESEYFISEQGSLLFSVGMIQRTLCSVYDSKNFNLKDKHSFVIWCRHYMNTLPNKDWLHPSLRNSINVHEQKLSIYYWEKSWDSYYEYIAKHGTKPNFEFAIPEVYFNYLTKYGFADRVAKMQPFICRRNQPNHYFCKFVNINNMNIDRI